MIICITPAAALPPDAEDLIEQREFVIAMDPRDLHMHPHEAWSIEMAQIFTAAAEGLFSYHPVTMEPEPALAESVESSEDMSVWTITLREDGRFSTGDAITSGTFADSWMKLLEPGADYHYASMLDVISGVRDYRTGRTGGDPSDVGITVVDDYTLRLDLDSPAPYLLNILCHHSFAAVHPDNLEELDPLRPEEFISSGPFQIASASDEEIYLTPNPYYWDRDALELVAVRIRLYESQWNLISDFQSALVHWSLSYINPALLADSDMLIGYPEYSTGFFYFSAVEGPYADPRIRRALALLVPWREIRSSETFYVPAGSLVPQTESYYGVEAVNARDREEAFRLLASTGYDRGEGLPPLDAAIYPGSLLESVTGEILGTWEEELGIETSLTIRPYQEYVGRERELSYDLAFISWVGDFYDPYSFLSLWHSESTLNLGDQYNPIYDAMIDRALRSGNSRERYELFMQAEQYLLNEATVLPLFHGVSMNLFHHTIIGGWSPNLLDIHPIKHLYFEPQPSLREFQQL